MITFRPIFYIIGFLALVLSCLMTIPMFTELYDRTQEWQSFALSGIIGVTVSLLFIFSTHSDEPVTLRTQEVFLLTALSWITLCLLGSSPFFLSQTLSLTFTDAVFESTSGLTTTGSTILINLDHVSRGFLLWRALLQGIGGIGIIVMALTILPFLRIGGMHLFHSEFSDRSEKILPRVSQITSAIFLIYSFLIIVCILLLNLAGMTPFDALCHGLSTISTGGFSTHNNSINAYSNNTLLQIILIVFMAIGGSTLILFIRFGRGETRVLWQDAQMRAYLYVLGTCIALLSLWNVIVNHHPFAQSLLKSSFSVVSIITTTGFITGDYSTWGGFPVVLFFFLMFSGGCTGSTSGGIKIFRFQVLCLIARTHLKLLRLPHGIFIPTYNKHPISESITLSVLTFFTLYGFSFAAIAAALALTDLDLITALSAAASSLGNVGPGLGNIIGPTGTFASLKNEAKWILTFAMLLGRLELLTILILFTPTFWRS